MQLVSLLRIVHLLLYFFIAAQGGFYLFGFYRVLSGMPAEAFIRLRKAADPVLAGRLKKLYALTLLFSIAMILYYYRQPHIFEFLMACIAMAFLIIDIVIALMISEPLNAVIANVKDDAVQNEDLRRLWLKQIYQRAFLSVGAMIALMTGFCT